MLEREQLKLVIEKIGRIGYENIVQELRRIEATEQIVDNFCPPHKKKTFFFFLKNKALQAKREKQ